MEPLGQKPREGLDEAEKVGRAHEGLKALPKSLNFILKTGVASLPKMDKWLLDISSL